MNKIVFLLLCAVLFSCGDDPKTDPNPVLKTEKGEKSRKEIVDSLLQVDPNNIDLIVERSNIYLDEFDFRQARNFSARAFALDSNNVKARSLYAWTMINKPSPPLREIERAQRHLKVVIEKDPKNPEAYLRIANTYSLVGDFKTSFEYLNEAIKLDEFYRDAYVLKGSNYRVLGNNKLAASSYETAVQIDNDFFLGYFKLGELYSEMGDPIALEYYMTARDLNPTSPNAQYAVAKTLQDIGQYNESMAEYRSILVEFPEMREAMFNQGYIKLIHQNELDSAVYYYTMTTDAFPDYTEAWYNLGLAYAEQGRTSDAARAYSTCLKLNPDYTAAKDAAQELR